MTNTSTRRLADGNENFACFATAEAAIAGTGKLHALGSKPRLVLPPWFNQ
jgi:hypothetical protein